MGENLRASLFNKYLSKVHLISAGSNSLDSTFKRENFGRAFLVAGITVADGQLWPLQEESWNPQAGFQPSP
jgi:hypothetical protein